MAHRRTALTCTSCDQPTAGDTGALCWNCTKTGIRDLASWALWDQTLQITRTKRDRIRRGADGPAGHHTDETPLPVNFHAAHIAKRHRATLTDWHDRLRTAIPLDHALPAWPLCKNAVTTWCTHPTCRRIYLDPGAAPATNMEMALALAAAPGWWRHEADAADLIHAAHRALDDIRAAADIPPPMLALGKCDHIPDTNTAKCGAELRVPKGQPLTTCPACGTLYDVDRRREQLLRRIDALIQPGPVIVAVLSDWMGEDLPLSTLRTWAQRKEIQKHGTDPLTRSPRYRFGDVRARFIRSLNEKAKTTAAESAAQHTDIKETLAA
jgi:hypothetical protein